MRTCSFRKFDYPHGNPRRRSSQPDTFSAGCCEIPIHLQPSLSVILHNSRTVNSVDRKNLEFNNDFDEIFKMFNRIKKKVIGKLKNGFKNGYVPRTVLRTNVRFISNVVVWLTALRFLFPSSNIFESYWTEFRPIPPC